MNSLSQRVAVLELSAPTQSIGLASDLRVIEMHVARAEAILLRYEQQYSCWTKPDLLLRMELSQNE